MTALDELLARIDTVVADCDASTMPPVTTESSCCDHHTQRCEVPDECCPACPEAVALAAFVADWGAQKQTDPYRVTAYHHVTEHGPVVEPPPVATPMPSSWWRRIVRRPRP